MQAHLNEPRTGEPLIQIKARAPLPALAVAAMKDDDRAALLRSRIETLRQYLAEGKVRTETAAMYRLEIARVERSLR